MSPPIVANGANYAREVLPGLNKGGEKPNRVIRVAKSEETNIDEVEVVPRIPKTPETLCRADEQRRGSKQEWHRPHRRRGATATPSLIKSMYICAAEEVKA